MVPAHREGGWREEGKVGKMKAGSSTGVSKLFIPRATYRKKFEGLGHSRRHAPLPWSGPLTVRLNCVAQGVGSGDILRDSWQEQGMLMKGSGSHFLIGIEARGSNHKHKCLRGAETKAHGTETSQVQVGVSVARGGSCRFHPDCSASATSSSSPPPAPVASRKCASASLNSP
ncbi:unnamed protein product [Pleuronectes platessa]|uniref:Uncharacterized protein n=1 Tax=Pleuronectes platessa TaxID=8262 RepID=A0A9N7YB86_PLEPL|nr:unnamed protein product [Pleuronectes platessa]